MSKLAALLLALPFLYAPAQASRLENMKKATVLVTNEGFLGGGRGTGILLSSTTVLTCFHMADTSKDEFFIYTYPFGTVVKAHVDQYDPASDLLTLRLETPVKLSVRPVFQPNIEDGDAITVIGNAAGAMKWYVTRGIVSGRERDYLMTDAQVHPGNSGGPWFNEKGEIVGISDWGLKRYPDISGGISGKTILATLRGWENQKKMMAALMRLFGGK